MNRKLAAAGLALLAAGGLAAGYLLGSKQPPAPPAPTGQAAATTVPELRPDFSLQDASGTLRSITEWDGRPLLINFWATWCPPCRREIPLLNALRSEWADQDFEVIGVAVDFPEDVIDYMRETPISYPMLIGEQDGLELLKAFGVETLGFPVTAFTDSKGRIVTLHPGELHRGQAEVILRAVAALDRGELDIEAARNAIRTGLAQLPENAIRTN